MHEFSNKKFQLENIGSSVRHVVKVVRVIVNFFLDVSSYKAKK